MVAGGPWQTVFDAAETEAHETCTTCPNLCRSACPVAEAEARETSAPHKLMVQAGLLKKDKLSTSAVADLPWHCTTCGACQDACLHDNEVPFWMMLTRQRVLERGGAPSDAAEAAAAFGVAGNLQGISLEPALESAVSDAGTRVSRVADTVYLPGCETLHASPALAVEFLRGVSLLGLGDLRTTPASSRCCGIPLAWAGEVDGFVAHAARYARELESANRLVVHDPACAYALRELYPRFGVPLRAEVVSVWSYVHDRLVAPPERPGGQASDTRYALLSSCHADRGLMEPCRTIVEETLGLELQPEKAPTDDCCGAAGLLPLTAPSTARAMAEARLEALEATGADSWIAVSPRCASHLQALRPGLRMVDLGGLLGGGSR